MRKSVLFGMLMMTAPTLAFAHGGAIDTTKGAISAALEKFETEEVAQIPGFAGTKGWIEGDKINVKVYLPNKQEIFYQCTMMEMGGGNPDMFTCKKM